MDSVHIGINLSTRSAKHDVVDAAQPVNVSKSQHGNDDSESNSTPVLKPIKLEDIGNQTPPKATDPSGISY
jgi:hypothetical protein